MSAPVKCGTCAYRWSTDDSCEGCKEYDYENEIFTAFNYYCPGTNADRIRNINNMDNDSLARLLAEICEKPKTVSAWLTWLNERMTE